MKGLLGNLVTELQCDAELSVNAGNINSQTGDDVFGVI